MDWIDSSVMRVRGVAKGKPGATHELTEAKQGTYHYTMGPYSQPVLHLKPGDRVIVETRDAFEGAIKTEQDKPSEILRIPFLNPQNGPIMIEGAEKGDTVPRQPWRQYGPAGHGAGKHHLPAGPFPGRQTVHRRRARLPGRW